MKASISSKHTDIHLPCIPSNYSRLIARELELQIRDLPRLLEDTQMPAEAFMQDDTLLTTQQQVQIIYNALQMTDRGDVGLRLGKRLTPLTHGVMGLLVNSSPNVLMMLKAIQAFVPTRMNFASLEIVVGDEYLECHCHFDIEVSEEVTRSLSEAFAMAFYECARFILGRPLKEATTYFVHCEPDYNDLYREFIPGKIAFSHPFVMVKFPVSICQIPNASASEKNYALAYKQCEDILSQITNQKGTFIYQVQKLMLSNPTSILSEEEVSAGLFMSKRTLARKLKEENSSYRVIRDDILSQQAARYLKEKTMSVEAIAAQLNYHDSANFRRAFKRWFNMTPDQYRKQHINS